MTTIEMTTVEREAALAEIAAREHMPARAESNPEDLAVRTLVVYYDRNGICGYKVYFKMGQLTATRVDSDKWSFQHNGQERDASHRGLMARKPKLRKFQPFDRYDGREGFRSTRAERF